MLPPVASLMRCLTYTFICPNHSLMFKTIKTKTKSIKIFFDVQNIKTTRDFRKTVVKYITLLLPQDSKTFATNGTTYKSSWKAKGTTLKNVKEVKQKCSTATETSYLFGKIFIILINVHPLLDQPPSRE